MVCGAVAQSTQDGDTGDENDSSFAGFSNFINATLKLMTDDASVRQDSLTRQDSLKHRLSYLTPDFEGLLFCLTEARA